MSNKTLLIALLLMCSTVAFGQRKIVVKSFKENSSDLSVRTQQRNDINGDPCSLIKIIGGDANYTFEGDIVGKPVYKGNQIWLYVLQGTKRLVMRNGSQALNYAFPIGLDYSTYELTLKSEEDYAKAAAIPTSIVVPGLGQMIFKNSIGKGAGILAGEGALIAGTIICHSQSSSYKTKSNMATTADDKINFMKQSDSFATASNVCLIGAACVYVYNVIDVILAKNGRKKDVIAFAPYIDMTFPSNTSYGVTLAFNF